MGEKRKLISATRISASKCKKIERNRKPQLDKHYNNNIVSKHSPTGKLLIIKRKKTNKFREDVLNQMIKVNNINGNGANGHMIPDMTHQVACITYMVFLPKCTI